jgi:hypothetical protein
VGHGRNRSFGGRRAKEGGTDYNQSQGGGRNQKRARKLKNLRCSGLHRRGKLGRRNFLRLLSCLDASFHQITEVSGQWRFRQSLKFGDQSAQLFQTASAVTTDGQVLLYSLSPLVIKLHVEIGVKFLLYLGAIFFSGLAWLFHCPLPGF